MAWTLTPRPATGTVHRYAIGVALYSADPTGQIEIQRAPDLNGAPDTANAVTLPAVPGSLDVYVDELPNDGKTRWYRIRGLAAGKNPSAWTGWVSGVPSDATGLHALRPPGVAPTVQEAFSETTTQGTLTLTVTDPQWRVTQVEAKTKSGTGAESAYATLAAATQNGTVSTYTQAVALVEKQASRITYRVTGYDAAGALRVLVEQAVAFGVGSTPLMPTLQATVDAAGNVTVVVTGDSDTQSVRLAASKAGFPSAATVGAAASANGRVTQWANVLQLALGEVAYLSAIAYGGTNGAGAASPLAQARADRAGTKAVEAPAATLTVTASSKTSETVAFAGTLGAYGVGPLQYRWRVVDEAAAYDAVTGWSAWGAAPAAQAITRNPVRTKLVQLEVRDSGAGNITGRASKPIAPSLVALFDGSGKLDRSQPVNDGAFVFGKASSGTTDDADGVAPGSTHRVPSNNEADGGGLGYQHLDGSGVKAGSILRGRAMDDGAHAASASSADGLTLNDNVQDGSARLVRQLLRRKNLGDADTIDAVDDTGTTYARTLAAWTNTGRPVVDYQDTIHRNRPSSPQNLVNKANFEDGSTGTWTGSVSIIAWTTLPFKNSMRIAAGGTNADSNEPNNWFEVKDGEHLFIDFWADTSLAAAGDAVGIGVQAVDKDGGNFWQCITIAPGTTWARRSGWVALPANVVKAKPYIIFHSQAGEHIDIGPIYIGRQSTNRTGSYPAAASSEDGLTLNDNVQDGGARPVKQLLKRANLGDPDTADAIAPGSTHRVTSNTEADGGGLGSTHLDASGVKAGSILRGRAFDDGSHAAMASSADGLTLNDSVQDGSARLVRQSLLRSSLGAADTADAIAPGASFSVPTNAEVTQISKNPQNLMGPQDGRERTFSNGYCFSDASGGDVWGTFGLNWGDVITLMADVHSGGTEEVWVQVDFFDANGATVGGAAGNHVTQAAYTGSVAANIAVPTNTKSLNIYAFSPTNNGETKAVRRFALYHGSVAMPYVSPPFRPERENLSHVPDDPGGTWRKPRAIDANGRAQRDTLGNRSVVPAHLAAGNYDNLTIDGSFEEQDASWTLESGWSFNTAGNQRSGTTCAVFDSSASGAARNGFWSPVRPGQVVYVEGWMKGVSGANGQACARLSVLDVNGAEIATFAGNTVPSDGTYYQTGGSFGMPANARYVRGEFVVLNRTAGAWCADDLKVRMAIPDAMPLDSRLAGVGGIVQNLSDAGKASNTFRSDDGTGSPKAIARGGISGTCRHGVAVTYPSDKQYAAAPLVIFGGGGLINQPEPNKWGTVTDITNGTTAQSQDTTKRCYAIAAADTNSKTGFVPRLLLRQKGSSAVPAYADFPGGDLTSAGGTSDYQQSGALARAPASDGLYHLWWDVTVTANYIRAAGSATLVVAIEADPTGSGSFQEVWSGSYIAYVDTAGGSNTTRAVPDGIGLSVAGFNTNGRFRLRAKSFTLDSGVNGSFTLHGHTATDSHHGVEYNTATGDKYANRTPDTDDAMDYFTVDANY